MTAHSVKLAVEALEDRCVPSTMVEANFNNDDYMDKAELTSPTTITVSLGSADGYSVSAILTSPKNQPMESIYVHDHDGDGNLDVVAGGNLTGKNLAATHIWLGNGDGTFDSRITEKWRWPPPGHHGGW